MLILIPVSGERPLHFDFGRPLEPVLTPEEVIERMIREYPARRDDLWEVPVDRAQIALGQMLAQGPADPRRSANIIESIGRAGAPDGGAMVRPYLADPNPDVKRAALRAIGQTGAKEDVPGMALLLRDPDPAMRRTAVIALGGTGELAMIPLLEQAAAREPELAVKVHGAVARIRSAHEFELGHMVDALLVTEEYEDLLYFVSFCTDDLKARVADPGRDTLVRARAARLLYLRRFRSAGTVFKPLLRDPDTPRELLLEVIRGCGICVIRSAFSLLLPFLRSKDGGLRTAAIEALGRIDEPNAFEPLVELWAEESLRPLLRLSLRRVAHIPGRNVLRPLLEQGSPPPAGLPVVIREDLRMIRDLPLRLVAAELESAFPVARLEATLLLGLFGTPEHFPPLAKLATDDPDPAVREAAQKAAARLKPAR